MAYHRGGGGLYSVIWIPILDSHYRCRPTKIIGSVDKGQECGPGLSVRVLELVVILLRLAVQ